MYGFVCDIFTEAIMKLLHFICLQLTTNQLVEFCFQIQINDSSVSHYVVTVGSNNFYLPYHVKIQSFNPKGRGPASKVVTIMSAEERK